MQSMPQPQPRPQPSAPKTPAEEGFVVINPPLMLYEPAGAHDVIRGYLLSRQEVEGNGNGGAFYCVQLTAARSQAGRSIEAGKLIAVEEVESIRSLSYLMPKLEPAPPSGELLPKSFYEIIVEPLRRAGDQWLYLIHARHLHAQTASPPVLRPPAFAMLEPPEQSEPEPGSSATES